MQAIEAFCIDNHLGILQQVPQEKAGGLTHIVFEIQTDRGHYALKILDDFVMTKPEALAQTLQGEAVAHSFAVQGIPAVCAIQVRGKLIQQLETGEFVLVYPWVPGQQKYYPDFGLTEVRHIARTLAKLHTAAPPQPSDKVVSHRDFDPKNVLWDGEEFRIIDWEAAGEIDPMEELIALAFEWSGFELGEVDQTLFNAFFKSYTEAGAVIKQNHLVLGLQGFIHNYEEWYAFNKVRLHSAQTQSEKIRLETQLALTRKKLFFLKDEGFKFVDLQK